MKEIDFLPEWYKSGRRRQVSYRTQSIALGGVFVVMVVWNFIAAHSISKATAELSLQAARQVESKRSSQEFAQVKSEVARLQERARCIEEIDSKIDVASVLAEISFLVGEKIVLSKVGFTAGKLAGKQKATGSSGSAVRVAGGNFASKEALPLGDVRFKVAISGVASDATDVAELICKLEDSPYFCQVIPSFTRNKTIKAGKSLTKEDLQVSEFEIGCCLANYR